MHEVSSREILKTLRELNAERVLIQTPEGLKREAQSLADFLEENGIEAIISGDINYGACDPADREAKLLGCDALIHLGHSYMRLHLEVPTIFIPAFAGVDVVPALEKNLGEVRKLGKRIALVTTAQHIHQLRRAKEFLEGKGFEVLIGKGDSRVSWPGQVLGCNFTAAKVDAEGVLFIGAGYFHPLGVAVATGKPTLAVNPYSGDAMWMDRESERLIRKRWAQIAKAMDAQKFGVVTSTKKGQLRLAEAKRIVNLLREHGKYARLIAMNHINYPALEGFDFDAYVVVACPRVPIDDYENWRKPVLTPAEVEVLLGLREDYAFDEILGAERKFDEPLGVSVR
ncbi:diphthamide biosynthesis enzyme Dph2 [Thermococcus thioreducens]|uniref:2-(3-amino-3-carboxypropyl)histidine synthase n=1 Tax=Thermococcus thioreducens TaxID=277988 RepID=A0A0Q2M3Q9_9EURY|nr:diphthamide biosynthesis enzyme Dph2 [Thermococcus thioreducens]ASJ11679.1 S-adenosyl-L-methionine--L-histidine 3-amino-3-carboxypropyltransferase [Thermococcus thioreducens]KQH82586.1 S-adenosyl-L-methionine:L-histidine 3-amino-3-carboxypropyltransferase [Thermococcus thioreducens]SEW15712.1 2-(3-amino-3-carboxypropyl)histidine synthase [Thermococcus thioreducens]